MKKLAKSTLPTDHTKDDLKAFGPPATKDGQFSGTKLADLGCYNDSNKVKGKSVQSNKYYFCCVCQSSKDNSWYVYTEWGRTNATTRPQFQMIECVSEEEAQSIYEKQCHSKNDKRGVWVDTPVGKVLHPKPKKDVYLVQQKTSRTVGLPDAKNISAETTTGPSVQTTNKGTSTLDGPTLSLLQDLTSGTISYARSIITGDLPTLSAIKEARHICDEANKLTNKFSQNDWADLDDLKMLTRLIYSKIPKYVSKGSSKLLTPDLVQEWLSDLTAFESVSSGNVSTVQAGTVSLNDLNLRKLKYIPRNEPKGAWIYDWMPKATKNRHGYIRGTLKIKNLFFVERQGDVQKISNYQRSLKNITWKDRNKVLHKPKRQDIYDKDEYERTNTFLLFHGTRSSCVKGILEQSFLLPKHLSSSQITGAMYGSGTYTADDIKKSIGYTSYKRSCWAGGSGSISGRSPFMFLCDTVLGNPKMPRGYTSGGRLKNNEHSVFAEGGTASVQNNEYVVFNSEAIRARYLVEFDI